MKRLNIYSTIVAMVFFMLTRTLGQLYPVSPCPSIFLYQKSQNTIIGIVLITPPVRASPFDPIVVNVSLSIEALLPSENFGSMELYEDTDTVISRLQTSDKFPILYRIRFPLLHPIPELVKIDVNDKTVCEALSNTRSKIVEKNFSVWYTITFNSNVHQNTPLTMRNFSPDPSTTSPLPTDIIKQPEVQCGRVDNFIPLVVNGKNTERGQWPWMTAIILLQNQQQTFQCGGSLISLTHVLTAAHCVKLKGRPPIKPNEIIVNLGSNFLLRNEDDTQYRDISKIIVHPSYKREKSENDIAILVLSTAALPTNYVQPVCLWPEFDTSLDKVINKEGSVVGWGRDESGHETTDQLKLTTLPVVSQEECLRSNNAFITGTSNSSYCAGKRDGSGPCSGDSGGGMFFQQYIPRVGKRWSVRGIVSFAIRDGLSCDLNNYIVFTDVAKFLPWIKEYMS